MLETLAPGQLLARGVCRHFRTLNFNCITEFVPKRGLRVDVIALGPKGEIWIVECKSSRADFMSDSKWQGYLEWCDQFFWAVDENFPLDLLPAETGLILADPYDASVVHHGPLTPLAAARRKAITLKLARNAAERLQRFCDPGPSVSL